MMAETAQHLLLLCPRIMKARVYVTVRWIIVVDTLGESVPRRIRITSMGTVYYKKTFQDTRNQGSYACFSGISSFHKTILLTEVT